MNGFNVCDLLPQERVRDLFDRFSVNLCKAELLTQETPLIFMKAVTDIQTPSKLI